MKMIPVVRAIARCNEIFLSFAKVKRQSQIILWKLSAG